MLVDEVTITLKAGHGGPGKVSFYPGMKSGPDGGNGGKGADIYVEATSDLTVLKRYLNKKVIEATNGKAGMNNRKFGRDGEDVVLYMPVGAVLYQKGTDRVIELTYPGEKVLVCRGGYGGKGNFEFKSSTNTTPEYAQPGLPGEEKHFKIILKLIADYGLIGFPNAGKSSLLNELTAANAKIGAYPFTTLEANLGVLNDKILADIPGLIEGASQGKGLGHKFLRHIEKTKKLLHCIPADSEDIENSYKTIRSELGQYNAELLDKEEIILVTKVDTVDIKRKKEVEKVVKKLNKNYLFVSIYDYDSIKQLVSILG